MAKVRVKKSPYMQAGGPISDINISMGLSSVVPYGIINSNTTGTTDDPISSTMKPIDEENSTIEAEKGEMIVRPDLGGLYKIGGKKHSQGGTPLAVEPGSFIFSNDTSLSFSKKERENLGLKGDNTKVNNTPAKILAREVNPKDYNKMLTILNDPLTSDISKQTAALMLAKYSDKISQIAITQEAKKNFRQGVPGFATEVSSPISREAQDMMKDVGEKQYMAEGGPVDPRLVAMFPHLYTSPFATPAIVPPPDKTGKWGGDNQMTPNPKTGKKSKTWNAMTDFPSPEAYAKAVGFTGNPQDIKAMQQWVGQQYPDLVSYYHNPKTGYGQPSAGTPYDGKLGVRWNAIGNDIKNPPTRPLTPSRVTAGPIPITHTPPTINPPKGPNQGRSNIPTLPWEGYDFQMNAAEKLSTAAPFLTALAQPTYYDMLVQKYTPNTRLDRLDNSEEISNIQQQASLAQREAYQNLPGQQASAISARAQAQAGDQIGQSYSRVNQANTQIANQESLYNSQVQNQDNTFNLGQVQQTYRNNILSNQRRNEQLANAANQSLSTGVGIQGRLDALSYAATAQALPFVTNEKDQNGNPLARTDANGRQYIQQGVPFDFNRRRLPIFNPSFGGLDSIGINRAASAGAGNNINQQLMDNLTQAVQSRDPKAIYAAAKALDVLNSGSSKAPSPIDAMSQLASQFYFPR